MKVFFDAGIIFNAAHHSKAKSRHLILESKHLGLESVSCDYAVEEARKNLTEKYPAAVADLARLLPLIKMEATVISGSVPSEIRKKDYPIFLSAVASKAKYLVTGDHRDFGKWIDKPFGPADNLLVVSPAWLFDKLIPKAY
jgi:predicted nucleic acid-binding protein